jgi:glycosyltransferase involved in cell wall biosynthesis
MLKELQQPKVSVIIPTFNSGRYLPEAVGSVFNQTLINWELIVVDDGSTDQTPEVIKPYLSDNRVKYLFQNNNERSAARNKGLNHSLGEYIQFLDADDLIHSEKLKRQSDYLDCHEGVDVVLSEYCFFKDNVPGVFVGPPIQKHSGDIKKDMLRGNFVVVNSPLTKKEAIRSVGGFDETLTDSEDWDLWLRMLLSGIVFKRIEDQLAFVRLRQKRTTGNRLNRYSGRYQVIKKNLKNVQKDSIYWHSAKRCFVRSKLAVMRENLYQGRFSKILKVILDKPHHLSVCGIIDFIMETLIIAK